MKTILARTCAGILLALTTVTVKAANPTWTDCTGDHYWTTVTGTSPCTFGNWAANPEGSGVTDIFNTASRSTNIVPGFPNGTVFFGRDYTCARFRPGGTAGDPDRLVTIGPSASGLTTFTVSGSAAELIDGGGMVQNWTFTATNSASTGVLRMSIGAIRAMSVNTGRTLALNLDIIGVGGITKSGNGTLVLGGSNSFTGDLSISSGVLKMGHPRALSLGGANFGSAVPSVIVNSLGVTAITVTAGGSGYTNPPLVTISGGGGSALASSTIDTNAGTVTSITVTNASSGYTNVPTVTLSGGGGTGATATAILGAVTFGTLDLGGQANVNKILNLNGDGYPGTGGALINSSGTTASLQGGTISSISVISGGEEFSYPVTVTISGGGGSGATATASLGLTSASITVTNGGINYSNAPTVTFSGGGASQQAQGTATVSGGVVQSVTITSPGRGYTSAPTLTFSSPTGTDAGASVDADHFTVVGVTVTDGGSGYTSQPTIDFTGGNGGLASAVANFDSVVLGAAGAAIGGSGSITINSTLSSVGSGPLTKNGSGVLTLTVANTYTGGTVINGGTLLANNTSGSATGPGAITINGGTLGGTGTVSGAVTGNTGGSIGAGNSAGTLTLAGGLNLSGGGTNVWQLGAPKDDSNGTGGTDFDQLALTGGLLTLGGNSKLLVGFTGSATAPFSTDPFWQASHTWTIVTLTGGATNPTNQPFANIANAVFNAGTFSNYVGTGGKIMLTFTPSAASKPVVTSQPQNVTTNWGKPASFSVTAIGTDPEYYQWYFQNASSPITGANTNIYSIAAVDPTNQGNYFVIITNSLGSATSDVASLTVIVTPSPTIDPLVGAGTSNVVLNWQSVVGASYQLYYNTNLNTTNWFLITNLVATGSSITVTDRPPATAFERYYRIIAQ